MKTNGGLGGVVRCFRQGMVEALTLVKEPLNVSKTSHPENDVKNLRRDIKRAGYRTLNERQITFEK